MDGVEAALAQAEQAATRVRALAATAATLAATAHAVAAAVRATGATPWRSVAADAFREDVTALSAAVDRAAAGLDDVGRLLQAHAARVDQRVTTLRVLTLRAGSEAGEVAEAALEQLRRALPVGAR
jgi:hypothetical protein